MSCRMNPHSAQIPPNVTSAHVCISFGWGRRPMNPIPASFYLPRIGQALALLCIVHVCSEQEDSVLGTQHALIVFITALKGERAFHYHGQRPHGKTSWKGQQTDWQGDYPFTIPWMPLHMIVSSYFMARLTLFDVFRALHRCYLSNPYNCSIWWAKTISILQGSPDFLHEGHITYLIRGWEMENLNVHGGPMCLLHV